MKILNLIKIFSVILGIINWITLVIFYIFPNIRIDSKIINQSAIVNVHLIFVIIALLLTIVSNKLYKKKIYFFGILIINSLLPFIYILLFSFSMYLFSKR